MDAGYWGCVIDELLYVWNWVISPSAVGAVACMALVTLTIWLFPSIVLGRKGKGK